MATDYLYLGWTDYGMLIFLLGLSAAIGIWHGCFGSKQATTKDFLMAGGEMSILPTAMSLLASVMSSATLLGVPVEIYNYGTMYLYCLFAWFFATYLTSQLFVPKFRQIGCVSIYAYLEKRFSLKLRICVTLTYIISNILFMSVTLYGPSLALSQVTGLDVWLAVISCGIICTFYTSIGGMKAVIWTDVVQTCVMFIGIILSIIFGFIDVGGISKVFRIANEGHRINFSTFALDPTIRYTFWSVMIGGTIYSTSLLCFLQTQAQRYMCVKTTRDAQKVAWINWIMCALVLILCSIVGLLIFAKYHDCDPLKTKLVARSDQFYPLFVIQTLGKFPGLTGIFIACIMSASLSSISSGVNSTTTVIIEDIYKRLRPNQPLSDHLQATISKYMSLVLGILTILLAFVMSYLTNILVIVFSIFGTLAAPIFGVFLLGFFFPRVNSRNALIGFIISLIVQIWILIGANLTSKQQLKKALPTSINGCSLPIVQNITFNNTDTINLNLELNTASNSIFLPLYSISFMWYAVNGVLITTIIALLCSLLPNDSTSNHDDEPIDPSVLISCRKAFCCCFVTQNMMGDPENVPSNDHIDKSEVNGRKYEGPNERDDSELMLSPTDIQML
ncbi:unnamed protein product [Rotaria socialis]|uniref:Sodium-coupled monocarboxylate transporter 1 n=3 Tax=Rotaria socialis TaxID=392032 RepID=A0A818QS35_9BILA|nr:unnamed protein product [Rotaria socialis]CAF4471834.1 unnamed protein product [Rotaria socialis]